MATMTEDQFKQLLTSALAVQATQLRNDVKEMFAQQSKAINKRFEYIDRRFESIEKRLDEQDLRLNCYMEEIAARFQVIDERFDAIDERFEAIDQRFEAIDERFDAVDRRFKAVDKRFDAIDKRFDRVEAKLDTKADGGTMYQKLKQIHEVAKSEQQERTLHKNWIKQLAANTNTKLVPEP